jgi:hypothetical protein
MDQKITSGRYPFTIKEGLGLIKERTAHVSVDRYDLVRNDESVIKDFVTRELADIIAHGLQSEELISITTINDVTTYATIVTGSLSIIKTEDVQLLKTLLYNSPDVVLVHLGTVYNLRELLFGDETIERG